MPAYQGRTSGVLGGAGAKAELSESSKTAAPDFAQLFEDLKKEASKTPEERARERVLEKNDLDEEAYQRLPKEKRIAIDAEIREAVKRVAEQRRSNMAAERMA